MANQITDNRILVATGASTAGWDDLSGNAAGTLDNEIFIYSTGSVSTYINNTAAGLLHDAGSAQNWSGNVFHLRGGCGIVPQLNTKANGGFRVRFCGASVSDWFEVYVGGSDSFPPTVKGLWFNFIIDIDVARAAAITNGWTNGTPPPTTAIRYVGLVGQAASMPRMIDNMWVNAIFRTPANTPGIIVEGRNGGSVDWKSEDIFAQLGDAAGVFYEAEAGWVINTPIQIGINDTTTHGFSDVNTGWQWARSEFLSDSYYKVSAIGGAGGVTNVKFGLKTGTGNDAVGGQGLTIDADASTVRWNMDFNDPNLNSVGLYGCSFKHGDIFDLDSSVIDAATVNYIDCTSATITDSKQLKVSVINPNTTDGVAFMKTSNLANIVASSFDFKDGHAIELLAGGAASQSNIGNVFNGAFGGTPGSNLTPASGSTDAMIYNNSGEAKTITPTLGGSEPSIRNGAAATTTVIAGAISMTLRVSDIDTLQPIENAQVSIYLKDAPFTELMNEDTLSDGVATEAYTGSTPVDVVWKVRKSESTDVPRYIARSGLATLTENDFELSVSLKANPFLN